MMLKIKMKLNNFGSRNSSSSCQACSCNSGSDCRRRKIDKRKYFYFTTLIVTRDDVNEYMKYHAEYTKANCFKDIVCKIYI